MCGIFAWAGKAPTKFSKSKLDVLGIFNEDRGRHSCGVTTDGEIYIGIESTKIYKDFIANSDYIAPNKYPVVIGHTRHATGGAHNLENAHPFGFGQYNDHYHFIGVHNGTLQNHSDIAKKYKIEESEEKTNKNLVTYRRKIDSEILLEAVFKTKGFKLLEEYDGAAALIFTNLAEPNTVYCYHGKSKKYCTDPEEVEERPLHFWQETRNSLYISSMPESLRAIGAIEDEIKMFDHNIVYKITDGNVSKATKFIINRKNQIQTARIEKWVTPNHNANQGGGFDSRKATREYYQNKQNIIKNNNEPLLPFINDDFVNIYKDNPLRPHNQFGGLVYMNKLRYLRNGHTINGCYTWVPNYGFFFLGAKIKDAQNIFYDFVNKNFWDGDFVRVITDVPKEKRGEMFIPFSHTGKSEVVCPQLYYFYNGIRIRTAQDYQACLDMKPAFTLEALSMCATHPICSIVYNMKPYNDQGIMFDGVLATDTICPLGSGKIYKIINGNCVSITISGEEAKDNIEAIENIENVVDRLKAREKAILAKETSLIVVEKEDDLLDKDLDEIFKESLQKFPSFIKRLEEYKKSSRAIKAKDALKEFLDAATGLMIIDINE
jgi:predicted glutamine amidotransferase